MTVEWTRFDERAGITPSRGLGFKMIEYRFNHKGKKYMAYNGNGYGQNGVLSAVLEYIYYILKTTMNL